MLTVALLMRRQLDVRHREQFLSPLDARLHTVGVASSKLASPTIFANP